MKVCFVAHSVYPFFFSGLGYRGAGGAEYQQKMIGLALSRRGFDVSFISFDLGQPDFHEQDGLVFIKSFRPDAGILGIRFFHPRLTKLWRALKNADADIYYCRTAGFLPGILAIFCRMYKKKFIFGGASDTDFMPGQHLIPTTRDIWLYHYGLRRSSAIVVQSNHQRTLLWKNFSLKGTVIRNLLLEENRDTSRREGRIILWVSNIRRLKRPEEFIELAKAFPGEEFVMIGGPNSTDPAFSTEIERECSEVRNLRFLGFQPIEKTEYYFDKAKVLVNTSINEGFPNTFLQAWSRGVPVLSYVDPDNVIRENGLGYIAESQEDLREKLSEFLRGTQLDAAQIQKYFNDNHSTKVVDKYCDLLKRM